MRTLLVCCMLGAAIGAALVWARLGGLVDSLQAPWQQLPTPPQPAAELAESEGGTIAVQASDGTRYACAPGSDSCWSEAAEQPEVPATAGRCDFVTVTHFVLSHRGAGIVSCRAAASLFSADGRRFERVVLDGSGGLWYQQWLMAPVPVPGLVLASVLFGAIAGLAVGVVIMLLRGKVSHART